MIATWVLQSLNSTQLRQVSSLVGRRRIVHSEKERRCFVVGIRLSGNHSKGRAEQAIKWMTAVTLNSVYRAAHVLKAKEPSTKSALVLVVLTVSDAYIPFAKSVANLTREAFGDMLSFVVRDGESSERPSPLSKGSCPLITVSRIDADDSVMPDYFVALARTVQKEYKPGLAVVSGTKLLDQVAVLKSSRHGGIVCSGQMYKRHYFHSVGLSVTLPYILWADMGYPMSFGDHAQVSKRLAGRVYKLTGKVVSVVSNTHYPLGIYWITQLSGHFADVKVGLSHASSCDQAELQKALRNSSVISEIIRTVKYARTYGAVPILTRQEMEQNKFWMKIKLERSRSKHDVERA